MTQLLELAHLVQEHGVADMDVRSSGSKPALTRSGFPVATETFELLQQVRLDNDLSRATLDDVQLFFGGQHIRIPS